MYGLVCGHMAHGTCGLCVRHMAWHMAPAVDVRMCAKRRCVPGHLLICLCGYVDKLDQRGHRVLWGGGVCDILAQLRYGMCRP